MNTYPEWYVRQFSSNVYTLVQQKSQRVSQFARQETQSAEKQSWDRIGPTDMIDKGARNSDTPLIDVEHSRRTNYMRDYNWATLVDKSDKIRSLNDPTSDYAKAAAMAGKRKKDDVFIAAALGDSYSGVDGLTAVPHPNSQKLVATNGTTATNLNVYTLRLVKLKFWSEEALEEEGQEMLHAAVSGSQLFSLLGQTEVTSSDYNSIKALVQGEVDTFMGFKFHRTERLAVTTAITAYTPATGALGGGSNLAAGARRCIFWEQSGMLVAIGLELKGRIDERADKNYSTQVYSELSLGSIRMEEEKVVEVICLES